MEAKTLKQVNYTLAYINSLSSFSIKTQQSSMRKDLVKPKKKFSMSSKKQEKKKKFPPLENFSAPEMRSDIPLLYPENSQQGSMKIESVPTPTIKPSTTPSLATEQLAEQLLDSIAYQSEHGISKTTMVVGNHIEKLKGLEIELYHFDTSPMSFQIQFLSSPEQQALLISESVFLKESLSKALPNHKIIFEKPSLKPFRKKERSALSSPGKKTFPEDKKIMA